MWNCGPESGRSTLRVIPFQFCGGPDRKCVCWPLHTLSWAPAGLLLWPQSCAVLKSFLHEALTFSPSSLLPSCFPLPGKLKYLATYKIKNIDHLIQMPLSREGETEAQGKKGLFLGSHRYQQSWSSNPGLWFPHVGLLLIHCSPAPGTLGLCRVGDLLCPQSPLCRSK